MQLNCCVVGLQAIKVRLIIMILSFKLNEAHKCCCFDILSRPPQINQIPTSSERPEKYAPRFCLVLKYNCKVQKYTHTTISHFSTESFFPPLLSASSSSTKPAAAAWLRSGPQPKQGAWCSRPNDPSTIFPLGRCAPLGSPSHSVLHYGGEGGQQGRMERAQPRELDDPDPPCELHQPRQPRPKAQAHQDDLLFVVLGHLVQHGKPRHDLVQGLVQQGSVQGSEAESRQCAGSSIARGTRLTNAAGNQQRQQQQQQRSWHKTQRWMLFSRAPLLFL